jgi:hypothetical protein
LRQVGETRLQPPRAPFHQHLSRVSAASKKLFPRKLRRAKMKFTYATAAVVYCSHSSSRHCTAEEKKVRSPLLMGDSISTTSSFSLCRSHQKFINKPFLFLPMATMPRRLYNPFSLSLSLSPAYPSVE